MDVKQGWGLVKAAASAWVDDYSSSMGAALAYYTMFSIAPLLLIVISIAGLVFGQDAARGEILLQLRGMMGEEGARAVEGLLESVNKPAQSAIATLVDAGVLLIGATTVFAELQSALDRVWRAPAREETSGLWNLLRSRLLSFGMILGIGFLLMVSLVASAAIAALGKWWGPMFEGWKVLAGAVDFTFCWAPNSPGSTPTPSDHARGKPCRRPATRNRRQRKPAPGLASAPRMPCPLARGAHDRSQLTRATCGLSGRRSSALAGRVP